MASIKKKKKCCRFLTNIFNTKKDICKRISSVYAMLTFLSNPFECSQVGKRKN